MAHKNIVLIFCLFIARVSAEDSLASQRMIDIESLYASIDRQMYFSHLRVNNFKYVSDQDQYGLEDYWASPSQTLRVQQGDCEDLAMLKLDIFVNQGVSLSELRLGYVYTGQNKQAHIVLYHSPDRSFETDKTLVYDSIKDGVEVLASRFDITPVLSFSRDGVFYHSRDRQDMLGPLQLLKGTEMYEALYSVL